VPFMTAIFGGQERIKVRRLEECTTCLGNGLKPGAKVRTCSTCQGQGVVNNMQRTPFGVFQNVQTCPNCRGSGEEVSHLAVIIAFNLHHHAYYSYRPMLKPLCLNLLLG
jgi:DnaJ-class molecular chaperone